MWLVLAFLIVQYKYHDFGTHTNPTIVHMTPTASHRRQIVLLFAALSALVVFVLVPFNASNAVVRPTSSSSNVFVPTVRFPIDALGRRELLSFCEEKYTTQSLNHFVPSREGTFQLRYFVCGKQFFNTDNGTIFFHTENEADVTLYLNHTGLMWENAEEFQAVMVFALHRYFGKSIPFGDDVLDHVKYLSSTQALADFAVLIDSSRATGRSMCR